MTKSKNRYLSLFLVLCCAFIAIAVLALAGGVDKSVKAASYTEYEIGKLVPVYPSTTSDAMNSQVYLKLENGELPVQTWESLFKLSSGDGLKVNGNKVTINEIKSAPEGLWLSFKGVNAGDVLSLSGTFTNDVLSVKYNIIESQFTYNGTTWSKHVESLKVGKLKISSGNVSGIYLTPVDESVKLPVNSWDLAFGYLSGNGITLNGSMVNMNNTVKSVNNTLYIGLSGVSTNAILRVGGVLSAADGSISYDVTDSSFTWTGNEWIEFVGSNLYQIGKVTVTSASSASAVYFADKNGNFLPVITGDQSWEVKFKVEDGEGITLNGKKLTTNDIKVPNNLYVGLGTKAKVGDILSIDGSFSNDEYSVKYVIEKSSFIWNGAKWESYFLDGQLAFYDNVSILDLGLKLNTVAEGTFAKEGLFYAPSQNNTTGSVKFQFTYKSTNSSVGCFDIRLRGSAWAGFRFRICNGGIETFNTANHIKCSLSSNVEYSIEIGVIDILGEESVWTYISVNGIIKASEIIDKSTTNANESNSSKFGEFDTSHISIYGDSVAKTVLSDANGVSITYVTQYGEYDEYFKKGDSVTLAKGKTYNSFVGWAINGKLYDANYTFESLNENITATAVYVDFSLVNGASIRLSTSADDAGIRFTAKVSESDLNSLVGKFGITDVSYGILIMPYDYLEDGQAPNLNDFTEDESLVKIQAKSKFVDGEYITFHGAMTNLYQSNYERLFAGRGYIELTFANGEVKTIYTPFDSDSNVRSIRYVAQRLQEDFESYNELAENVKWVVDEYSAKEQINLIKYDEYAKTNSLDLIAWYYPELDQSNCYYNDTNVQIAKLIKDAGMTAVYLDGMYHLDLNTVENVEKTRQIIDFFWSQGLKTIAFASNGSTNCNIDYSQTTYPDFSDCDGFIGFLVWDEPIGDASMQKLAEFAKQFEVVYGGADVTFMTNLLPAYASEFKKSSSWNDKSTINKQAYKNYLEQYIDTVLSQVKGEKWLSMDSYPIYEDKSLGETFLYDLAMLKYYSLKANATSHAVLQSSGWFGEGNTDKARMPTEGEMRMQAYTAMAFGIDSISWWSYSDMRGDKQHNPTDSEEYYQRFKVVNNELSSIGHIYKSFKWKGVILGVGKDNSSVFKTDRDYVAYSNVQGGIGTYELSSSDTKHLSSVTNNKANLNYLLGVMEDFSGNEGYIICNYNDFTSDTTQTVTLTFNKNITEIIVYRGGVATVIPVTNNVATISLSAGEGVIVLPSKLG